MVKRRLPIGPACRAVSGVGQNDRRRRCPRGLLVHATRALQTRLDGRPDADSDRDKDMLVIVDQDIELFPGDGALLDAAPKDCPAPGNFRSASTSAQSPARGRRAGGRPPMTADSFRPRRAPASTGTAGETCARAQPGRPMRVGPIRVDQAPFQVTASNTPDGGDQRRHGKDEREFRRCAERTGRAGSAPPAHSASGSPSPAPPAPPPTRRPRADRSAAARTADSSATSRAVATNSVIGLCAKPASS